MASICGAMVREISSRPAGGVATFPWLARTFEVGGWPEFTVIVRFWLFAGICVALAIGIFYADFLHLLGNGIE